MGKSFIEQKKNEKILKKQYGKKIYVNIEKKNIEKRKY